MESKEEQKKRLDKILNEMLLVVGETLLENLKQGKNIKECLDFLKANRRSLPEGVITTKDESADYIKDLVEQNPQLIRR